MADPETPHRLSTITLREITEDNWRPVANLKVLPTQQGNLAPNPMSMVEAHYSEDSWMRAVYADETIVGFLMMALWPPTEGYYIWRFSTAQPYHQPESFVLNRKLKQSLVAESAQPREWSTITACS